jgi:hypothetical protein
MRLSCRQSWEHSIRRLKTALEQEGPMKVITEFTIAALVAAFLVRVAFQMNHAQAEASIVPTVGWGLRL